MEELSETERLIIAYVESHSPEECVLDKISRGINKSRATVLKYLEMLDAKGILSYWFIGRNKLWALREIPEKGGGARIESARLGGRQDARELMERAAELYMLKSREASLKESIDHPDMIIFSINNALDMIAYNGTFEAMFGNVQNFKELVPSHRIVRLNGLLSGQSPGKELSADMELMEKPGVYRPYHISFAPIVNGSGTIVGISAAGEELTEYKRTKRELEALLYITREAGTASDERQLLGRAMQSVKESLLPFSDCAVFVNEGGSLRCTYRTFDADGDYIAPGYLLNFITSCMGSMETVTAKSGDFALESLRSDMRKPSIRLMAGIPLIDGDGASGAILLLMENDAIGSVSLENVEIVADEMASGLKMLNLGREKNEYVSTLLAMNRVSGIINGSADEDSMLEHCIASTMDTLGFEMGCVYLEDDHEELSLRVHRNLPESLRKMCISGMFKGLFSKAFEKNNLEYITVDSEEYGSLDPAIKANGVQTLLILPIKNGKKIVGLLNMGSRERKIYNAVSLENLGSIGLQLGVALERSRLAIKLGAQGGQPNKI